MMRQASRCYKLGCRAGRLRLPRLHLMAADHCHGLRRIHAVVTCGGQYPPSGHVCEPAWHELHTWQDNNSTNAERPVAAAQVQTYELRRIRMRHQCWGAAPASTPSISVWAAAAASTGSGAARCCSPSGGGSNSTGNFVTRGLSANMFRKSLQVWHIALLSRTSAWRWLVSSGQWSNNVLLASTVADTMSR